MKYFYLFISIIHLSYSADRRDTPVHSTTQSFLERVAQGTDRSTRPKPQNPVGNLFTGGRTLDHVSEKWAPRPVPPDRFGATGAGLLLDPQWGGPTGYEEPVRGSNVTPLQTGLRSRGQRALPKHLVVPESKQMEIKGVRFRSLRFPHTYEKNGSVITLSEGILNGKRVELKSGDRDAMIDSMRSLGNSCAEKPQLWELPMCRRFVKMLNQLCHKAGTMCNVSGRIANLNSPPELRGQYPRESAKDYLREVEHYERRLKEMRIDGLASIINEGFRSYFWYDYDILQSILNINNDLKAASMGTDLSGAPPARRPPPEGETEAEKLKRFEAEKQVRALELKVLDLSKAVDEGAKGAAANQAKAALKAEEAAHEAYIRGQGDRAKAEERSRRAEERLRKLDGEVAVVLDHQAVVETNMKRMEAQQRELLLLMPRPGEINYAVELDRLQRLEREGRFTSEEARTALKNRIRELTEIATSIQRLGTEKDAATRARLEKQKREFDRKLAAADALLVEKSESIVEQRRQLELEYGRRLDTEYVRIEAEKDRVLQEQLDRHRRELEAANGINDDLAQQVSSFQWQVDLERKEKESTLTQMEVLTKRIREQEELLAQARLVGKEAAQEIQQRLDSSMEEFRAVKLSFEDSQNELQAVQDRERKLREQQTAAQVAYEGKLKALEVVIKEKEGAESQALQQLGEARQHFAQREAGYAAREKERERLLEESRSGAKAARKAAEKEAQRLRLQIEQGSLSAEELARKLKTAEQDRDGFRRKAIELDTQDKDLRLQFDAKIKELNALIGTSTEEARRLKVEMDRLLLALDTERAETTTLKRQITQLQEHLEAQEASGLDAAALQSQKEELETLLAEERRARTEQNSALQDIFIFMGEESSKLGDGQQFSFEDLRKKFTSNQEERRKLSDQVFSLQSQLNIMTALLAQTEQALAEEREKTARLEEEGRGKDAALLQEQTDRASEKEEARTQLDQQIRQREDEKALFARFKKDQEAALAAESERHNELKFKFQQNVQSAQEAERTLKAELQTSEAVIKELKTQMAANQLDLVEKGKIEVQLQGEQAKQLVLQSQLGAAQVELGHAQARNEEQQRVITRQESELLTAERKRQRLDQELLQLGQNIESLSEEAAAQIQKANELYLQEHTQKDTANKEVQRLQGLLETETAKGKRVEELTALMDQLQAAQEILEREKREAVEARNKIMIEIQVALGGEAGQAGSQDFDIEGLKRRFRDNDENMRRVQLELNREKEKIRLAEIARQDEVRASQQKLEDAQRAHDLEIQRLGLAHQAQLQEKQLLIDQKDRDLTNAQQDAERKESEMAALQEQMEGHKQRIAPLEVELRGVQEQLRNTEGAAGRAQLDAAAELNRQRQSLEQQIQLEQTAHAQVVGQHQEKIAQLEILIGQHPAELSKLKTYLGRARKAQAIAEREKREIENRLGAQLAQRERDLLDKDAEAQRLAKDREADAARFAERERELGQELQSNKQKLSEQGAEVEAKILELNVIRDQIAQLQRDHEDALQGQQLASEAELAAQKLKFQALQQSLRLKTEELAQLQVNHEQERQTQERLIANLEEEIGKFPQEREVLDRLRKDAQRDLENAQTALHEKAHELQLAQSKAQSQAEIYQAQLTENAEALVREKERNAEELERLKAQNREDIQWREDRRAEEKAEFQAVARERQQRFDHEKQEREAQIRSLEEKGRVDQEKQADYIIQVARLQGENAAQLEAKRAADQSHLRAVEENAERHQRMIQDLASQKQRLDAARVEEVDALKAQIQEEKDRLAAQNQEDIAALQNRKNEEEAALRARIEELDQKHATDIRESEDRIERLRAQMATEQDATLQAQLRREEANLQIEIDKHDADVELLQKQAQQENQLMAQKLEAMRNEALAVERRNQEDHDRQQRIFDDDQRRLQDRLAQKEEENANQVATAEENLRKLEERLGREHSVQLAAEVDIARRQVQIQVSKFQSQKDRAINRIRELEQEKRGAQTDFQARLAAQQEDSDARMRADQERYQRDFDFQRDQNALLLDRQSAAHEEEQARLRRQVQELERKAQAAQTDGVITAEERRQLKLEAATLRAALDEARRNAAPAAPAPPIVINQPQPVAPAPAPQTDPQLLAAIQSLSAKFDHMGQLPGGAGLEDMLGRLIERIHQPTPGPVPTGPDPALALLTQQLAGLQESNQQNLRAMTAQMADQQRRSEEFYARLAEKEEAAERAREERRAAERERQEQRDEARVVREERREEERRVREQEREARARDRDIEQKAFFAGMMDKFFGNQQRPQAEGNHGGGGHGGEGGHGGDGGHDDGGPHGGGGGQPQPAGEHRPPNMMIQPWQLQSQNLQLALRQFLAVFQNDQPGGAQIAQVRNQLRAIFCNESQQDLEEYKRGAALLLGDNGYVFPVQRPAVQGNDLDHYIEATDTMNFLNEISGVIIDPNALTPQYRELLQALRVFDQQECRRENTTRRQSRLPRDQDLIIVRPAARAR